MAKKRRDRMEQAYQNPPNKRRTLQELQGTGGTLTEREKNKLFVLLFYLGAGVILFSIFVWLFQS